jgi:hypothetical protein
MGKCGKRSKSKINIFFKNKHYYEKQPMLSRRHNGRGRGKEGS